VIRSFDKDGNQISWEQSILLMADDDYRRVAWTRVIEGVTVSTVWLPFDHNYMGHGPPLIFETMIFHDIEPREIITGHVIDREGGELWRWTTHAAAVQGHQQVVAELLSAAGQVEPVEEWLS
jgi:hypothetical protein